MHTEITPAQCRMARAALRIGVRDLATKANVASMTVSRFENETSKPIPATLAAIRRALEEAGVSFIGEDDEGPGVRLRKGDVPNPSPPFPVFRPNLPFGPGRFGVWVQPGHMDMSRTITLIQMTPTPQVPQNYDSVSSFWANIMSDQDTLNAILDGALRAAKGLRRVSSAKDVDWYFWQPSDVFKGAFKLLTRLCLDFSSDSPSLIRLDTSNYYGLGTPALSEFPHPDWSLYDEPPAEVPPEL